MILPEHLHGIWQLPPEDSDYSTRWLLIKARFSMATPKSEYANPNSVSGSDDTGCMPFSTKQDYRNPVDYIHYNPVKHGHAKATKDWPHSSFHRWVKQGYYDAGWSAPLNDIGSTGGMIRAFMVGIAGFHCSIQFTAKSIALHTGNDHGICELALIVSFSLRKIGINRHTFTPNVKTSWQNSGWTLSVCRAAMGILATKSSEFRKLSVNTKLS